MFLISVVVDGYVHVVHAVGILRIDVVSNSKANGKIHCFMEC
jgi:hypothetical protein